MADNNNSNSVRQRIISSVFSRRNALGNLEETYVGHIKIWEDAGAESSGMKPRYILLSQASNGTGLVHKSKLNTNGTFSVGKTWQLPELRALQVVNSLAFNITLSRTYKWQTENSGDQASFLAVLIRLFRTVTAGAAPLQLEGLPDPDAAPSGVFRENESSRAPTPPGGRPPTTPRRLVGNLRPITPSQSDHELTQNRNSPTRSASRSGFPSRPSSPTNSTRGYPSSSSRSKDPASSLNQPASPASQASSLRHRQGRHNATSTTSSTPSINLPPRSISIANQALSPSMENGQRSGIRPSLDVPSPSIFSPSGMSLYSPDTPRVRAPSPALSLEFHRPSSRSVTPAIADAPQPRRDHNARVSFFDPANQAALDRLISGASGVQSDVEVEEESAQATMANVEEMLEGYEWASEEVIGRKTSRGAADLIKARLLDELTALEKANIHSFLESDDRIGIVLKYLDEAVSELDNMDSLVSSYKIHLNAVSDDISYIQSQNRGLQVQTQNQLVLLSELEKLLQTVHVDREALMVLTQESLEKASSISKLEEAATELYKALQAGRETDMAATMERLEEYKTHNAQFCKRMFDFLSIMFTARSKMLLGDNDGVANKNGGRRASIIQHQEMEQYLGRYAALILYLKEMDESVYAKLCAAYFSASSELHSQQIKGLLPIYAHLVKKAPEDDQEQNFGPTPITSGFKSPGGGIRRAGTIIRSPIEGRKDRDKDKHTDGDMRTASEVFGFVLEQIAPQIYREDDFITDFLQINDAALTFADYMGLDNYFRRQAARAAGLSQSTIKLVRGALDLIFGFLPAELKTWLDNALAKDSMQIIGIIACLERFLVDAEERGNVFLLRLLEKQHMRLKGLFDRHIIEQINGVERTKLTSKKRKGVAHFVKYFPLYIGRVENQLIGADGLEIRGSVDLAYEKIVHTMFESLKQMAKLDGEGEDKGQLNYHVILIENMHHFVAETTQLEITSVAVFLKQAERIYDENLSAYVKIVLRRPFAKILDYFEGVERLLKTTAPTEVANNGTYSKSALKKVAKEYNAKDIRKHVDVLFKRVEKHFTEASEKTTTEESGGIAPGTVMVGVWKACEEELLRITELFSKRISQCYADSGVSLDYTVGDVEAAFRRHRVGG